MQEGEQLRPEHAQQLHRCIIMHAWFQILVIDRFFMWFENGSHCRSHGSAG